MKKLMYLIAGMVATLTANAQLQNLDFENWDFPIGTLQQSNIPTGWTWTSGTLVSTDNKFYYPPSTNAQHNNYALYLSVWYDYTKDAAFQKAAIAERPVALNGWYDYKHNIIAGPSGFSQADTAKISVFVTKHNHNTHTTDTLGKGILEIGDSTANYTAFSINIEYTSTETPDSITVFLDPSLVKRYGPGYQVDGARHIGGHTSFFWVDNLSLVSSTTGIKEATGKEYITVYPNPADNFIYMGNNKGTVLVSDITGKNVLLLEANNSNKIDIGALAPGAYIMQIKGDKKSYHAKFIKQ